ncbi:MAG: hypothetical protein JXB35_04650, partial [Anaerolineae bacterium]|nr:hypothetical protein [Anaerolineae bacterium]
MKKRWALPLVLTLILAIPLGFLLYDFARDTLADWVLYVVWWGRQLFNMIPQVWYWVSLIIVVAWMAFRSLHGVRHETPSGTPVAVMENPGRVRMLYAWIESTERGEYFKWRLAQYLGKLLLGEGPAGRSGPP